MIPITPVEPMRTEPVAAFVERQDRTRSGLEWINWPIYPRSPMGVRLRAARKAAGLSLGQASRRAGLRPSEWSGLECGNNQTTDAGWAEAMASLKGAEP